jgi:hypothetical protein
MCLVSSRYWLASLSISSFKRPLFFYLVSHRASVRVLAESKTLFHCCVTRT